MINRVRPASAKGFNISWNLNLLSGPKWTIKCGNCYHTFRERIAVIDNPSIRCPACGAINELPVVVGRLGEA